MKTHHNLKVVAVFALLFCFEISTHDLAAQETWTDPPLGSVSLHPTGPIAESLKVNRKVLDAIGVDRALLSFRVQAGLPTKGAKPLGGWASPEPYGPFPGFFESHFLSAIAMQSRHDPELGPWVHEMIAGLAECQRSMGGQYLFASPVEEFKPERLDGVVWYRMHKLLEGLLAAHKFAQSDDALRIAVNLGLWIEQRVDDYGDDFAKVKKIEYGGMTEAFANLYESTGRDSFRAMALKWEEPERILKPFAEGNDFNEHANTLLAKMVGAARLAELTNSEQHRKASENFWENICGAGGKTYATGGTSVHEGMPGMRKIANTTLRMPQETCVSYNLMKVTRSLYRITGQIKYIEYYERLLWNAILGSQDPKTGYKTYYQPLGSNSIKDFRSNELGCYCCNGTGLENPPRSAEMIYALQPEQIRVQLFVPSTIKLIDWGVSLVQTTEFPNQPKGRLLMECKNPRRFTLSLRVPSWLSNGGSIKINGEELAGVSTPSPLRAGDFFTIEREWKDQDTVEYNYPYRTEFVAMPDDERQVALLHGPLVMVGVGANDTRGQLDLPVDAKDSQSLRNWLKPNADPSLRSQDLEFEARDGRGSRLLFRPYYQIPAETFFTGYWQLGSLPENAIPKKRNLALGKPTECSTPEPVGSNLEAFMRSAKAVDGNYGGADDWYTKWFPNGLSPQWIVIDLEKAQMISKVQWIAAKEDLDAKIAYRYRLESSLNKVDWEQVADASENREFREIYEHEIPVRMARYIRLTTLPIPDLKDHQARPKIAEVLIYGDE